MRQSLASEGWASRGHMSAGKDKEIQRLREERLARFIKPRGKDVNTCTKKLVYKTKQEANNAAARYKLTHKTLSRPYKCAVCKLWHLTTKITRRK